MFANISQADKEAFFSLLDEYFATRGGVAAVSAARGPAGQAALSKLGSSAGHIGSGVSSRLFGAQTAAATTPASTSATAAENDGIDHSARPSFTALRGAFANAQSAVGARTSYGKAAPPPPPTRGVAPAASTAADDSEPPPVIPRRTVPSAKGPPAGLQSGKHFGSAKVDLTSGSTVMASMFGRGGPAPAPGAKTASPPSVGAASSVSSLAKNLGGLPPPPVRRVASSTAPPPPPAPEPEPEPEEEAGEWASALYEYTSDDKADLHFAEGARIKIIEKTSDDWWTGELNGKQGLFPASYVEAA